jgi:outer membrane biosynthesis protein TonB
MRVPDRRRHRLPTGAVIASTILHAVVGLSLAAAGAYLAPRPLPAQTFRVHLVAAADETAPMRLRPQPAKVAEEENRPPPPEPTPAPKPRTEVPTVVEQPPPVEPSKEPARGPEEGDDPINVHLEGAAFVDPAYLENIILQVHRYWRPPTGNRHLRAEVVFTILEDGSVERIEWVQRSGDLSFDLEAHGAVEAAGRARAFGPLPEAWPRDRLRVSFFFDPASL